MTEKKDIPEARKLTDEELEEVTGGTWIWDIDIERGYEFLIEKKFGKKYGEAIGVGAFLVILNVDPVLRDLRQRWIADGCPKDKTYHYNNAKKLIITERGGRI